MLHLITSSLTNKDAYTLQSFGEQILTSMENWEGNSIVTFPEYCWGQVETHQIMEIVDTIQNHMSPSQQVVFGSFPHKIEDNVYNSAIYVNGAGKREFIPKTNVLQGEQERSQVVSGRNPGYIEFNGIKTQIIICGDLWNSQLLNRLLKTDDIDLLLIPALTVVPKGYNNYAKLQWYSLTISRSREYIIPIVVADHETDGENYSVGGASSIADPSLKTATMSDFDDFLYIPTSSFGSYSLNPSLVKEYKSYRKRQGLYLA